MRIAEKRNARSFVFFFFQEKPAQRYDASKCSVPHTHKKKEDIYICSSSCEDTLLRGEKRKEIEQRNKTKATTTRENNENKHVHTYILYVYIYI